MMHGDNPAAVRMGYPVPKLTIGHVLADKAATLGERPFLHYLPDGRRYSFRDMDRLSNALANGLLRTGIRQGEHVAVMMDNCPEQLLLYFALGKIGAVAVPINTAARGQLLQYYLNHSGAVALFMERALLRHFLDVRDGTPEGAPLLRCIGLLGPGADDASSAAPAHAIEFEDLLDAPDSPPDVAVKFSDLAYLLFTSGTTGPSKAVMFTHAYAMIYGIDQAENYGYRDSDVVYVCLPLFHSNGLLSNTYGPLATGARVALSRRFSASNFWREVRESGTTAFSVIGSIANILWSREPRPEDRDHCVRQANIVPVPSAGVAFEKRFGFRIVSNYGLTDYATATIYRPGDPVSKLGSAGRARRGMQLRIFDENDMEVPIGEVGEIVLRSDYPWATSPGYYKMPDATLASRRNFWFHTGDRGYLDEDGFLFFADRKKDAIRRRGENISTFEVEQVVVSHPAVADAAVFPVSSPLGEEEVAVAVVLSAGMALSEPELIEHCRRNMAYFMVPRYVRILADLPRNALHKVEKYKLREQTQAILESCWDRDRAGVTITR